MKGGAKGGGGVEIDLKTSSLSNGFNFPLETALWVFFPGKSDEKPFCFFTFTAFLHLR